MFAREPENPGSSFVEVLARRSTVALATFLIVALAAVAFVMTHKVKYGALSHVVLVNDPNGRDPTVTGADMPTIVTGSTVLLDVRQRLGLPESVNDLRKNVNARVAPKSSLMTIAFQSPDPREAIAVDNALVDSFSKLYWHLAGSRYDAVTRRLNKDVEAARARLASLDQRLESASADASYVGSQASLDASAAHLGELQENRGLALAQLVADRANRQADRDEPGKTAKIVRHEILMNDAAYRETQTQAGKDLAEYTTTRASVNPGYPGIAGFTDKIEKEQLSLYALRAAALAGPDAYSPSQAGQIVRSERDDAAVQGDEAKLAAFDQQIGKLENALRKPSGNVPSMGALRAKRDAAEAQMQALSLRLSNAEANSAEASSLGQVVVVDRATDARPTLVGPLLLLALGLLAAIGLAIAAAYLTELLVPRLLGSADVEGVYGRPILATLRSH